MNVKQRMLSLKLLKEKKNYSEFLEEIGVAATVRVNSSEKETDEKKYSSMRERCLCANMQ